MSLVEDTRKTLRNRRAELLPAVAELAEIDAVLDALGEKPTKRTTRKAARTATKTATRSRSKNRAGDFIAIVQAQPGINVSAIAKEMGLSQPTYLYKIKRDLMAEGKIVQEDGGLKVVGAEPETKAKAAKTKAVEETTTDTSDTETTTEASTDEDQDDSLSMSF